MGGGGRWLVPSGPSVLRLLLLVSRVLRLYPPLECSFAFVNDPADAKSELNIQTTNDAAAAAALVDGAKRIVVLTGAGISTDSEIPDYRGPKGVWTTNPGAEKRATIQNYVADPEIRERAWASRLDSPVWNAKPNVGHFALLALEARNKLDLLITQNVDGLHHKAGSDPDRMVEIHGSIREVVCLTCDYRKPMAVALDRVRAGEADPACPQCQGILKSSTISFGQSLIDADLERSARASAECDLMLAIGSTLGVFPIANVVPIAVQSGASLVIVNGSPTEMDSLADIVVRASISAVLPTICGVVSENGGEAL